MAANEGWWPSERLRINKHHGWRASKPSRTSGRISGRDSERVRKLANLGCRASQMVWKAKRISGRDSQRVLKVANRRFRASFRPLTSNHWGGHRSPVIRKEAASGGQPADRWRFSTARKTSLSQAGHRTDDERFVSSQRLHDLTGWPAVASKGAWPTARLTNSVSAPSRTASASTTCTPRCCTCWASTTNA